MSTFLVVRHCTHVTQKGKWA